MSKVFHVFCDESCQTNSRYMVYGGVILERSDQLTFDVALQVWRNEHNMQAELKWTKVSQQKQAEYVALADMFFKRANAGLIHFKSAVFDTHRINYRQFFGGSTELGFYRFYYHFLLHKFACYARSDEDRILIYFDERNTPFKLGDLRDMLNRGIRRHFGRRTNVIRAIEPVDSHQAGALQVADVLMGAVGFHNNEMHLCPGAKRSKVHLAAHIAKKAGVPTLAMKTWIHPEFEIWPFKLAQKKKTP